MRPYHKIQSLYKRDEQGRMMLGDYSDPAFEYLAECHWSFEEKVDGTNIRLIWDHGAFRIGGKTDNAQIPVPLYDALNALMSPDRMGRVFSADDTACLYGEGYGARIQKGGGRYRDTPGFVLFDVRVGDWWLKREDVADVAGALHLDRAPVIGQGTLAAMVAEVRQGFESEWGAFPAEGIVARPLVDLTTRQGHRIITKLKTKDFTRLA